MLPSYATFKDEIEQIENYMQSISCYNQILRLDVSKLEGIYNLDSQKRDDEIIAMQF